MSPAALADGLVRFGHAQARADPAAAVSTVEDLLAVGTDPVEVLVDVIAAGQRVVGTRWQRGEWTVAQEHAATAVAVAATRAVRRTVDRLPRTRGSVVVACAEREWHELPAMIIGCALRAAGWDTTVLGASTTPARLNQHLHDHGPDATAVSCSVLGALPAARRFIEASTAAGVPVLVGGSAFGADDTRAQALGATGWAPGARQAVAAVGTLPSVVPLATPLPTAPATEQAALSHAHDTLFTDLRTRWLHEVDRLCPPETKAAVTEVTSDVLNQALHAVSAALLTADPRLVPETATWIADLLTARGAPGSLVEATGAALRTTLRDHPLAHTLVIDGWSW